MDLPVTYHPETSQGFESSKIASFVVPYLQGRFLDLGCGVDPVWPTAIGIDNYKTFGNAKGIKGDIKDLSMFTDRSIDAVFSSHVVEDFERSQVPALLKEWARVLKVGGYMVLYVPSANLYPKVGEKGANIAHKWDIYPGDLEKIFREEVTDCGWELRESEERGGTNEYSLLIVLRKTKEKGWKENIWQRNPDGKKRCLVIRYGALGDSIQTTSIFPLLKAQGYHLTVNCQSDSHTVMKHNPYVDEWIAQEKDFVPNAELGPYWDSLKERYDRIINLCESIEGSLLTLPGRLQHAYPDDIRRSMFGTVNYQERVHQIAGVSTDPKDFNPRFHMTRDEKRDALAIKHRYTEECPVISWAVAGSATHKIYPYTHVVIQWLLKQTNMHVVLLGDAGVCKALQDDMLLPVLREHGCDMGRVHPMCGKWKIRESMSFAMVSDAVIGPETGLLNAVSHEDVPKVLYLSHSSKMNLTEYWKNCITLAPATEKAPCFPCHRLHTDWTHCFGSEETGAALCASSIPPETVFEAIAEALGVKKEIPHD